MKLERDVKEAIKKVLKSLSIWYYMPSSMYRRGIPDFVCCVRGRFVGIEAKSPKKGVKGLTPLQIVGSRDILAAGGEYMVVWDEETIKNMGARLIILVDKGRNNVR